MNKEQILEDLKQKNEMIPDEHDGSYELMREIIASYAKLDDYTDCSFVDLNAVYAMAIGTWKMNVEKKKEYVDKTCLPETEKTRVKQVLDKVWDNACQKKYANREYENKPSVGMFGTGFYSFERAVSDEDAAAFIEMMVGVSKEQDDEEMFVVAAEVLDNPFKGMQAASASVMLHCLKPLSFPIINSNAGHGTIYEKLGIKLDKAKESITYISNCRKIKEFRDQNLPFKNYRILDKEAWSIEENEEPAKGADQMNINSFEHNIILYGPPGTGKTYNTMAYAVAIIEGSSLEDVKSEISQDYAAVKDRYEEYKENGQIAFTTFHQSYGYEEFIEGIRPVIDSDKSDISYTIEPGIFKKFCDDTSPSIDAPDIEINKDATTWYIKIYPDKKTAEEILNFCIEEGTIRMNWSKEEVDAKEEHDFLHWYKYDIEPGDYVVASTGGGIVRAVGVFEEGDAFWDEKLDSHHLARKVKWLAYDMSADLKAYNNGISHPRFVISRLKNCTPGNVHKMLIDSGAYSEQANDDKYVFIIDEINRGNISKIFGELITLIEETKRDGSDEAMSVTLPYSKVPFSVPDNVYIIGTMNTADRSIALMDTALRRRFSFKEMMPDPDVLREIGANTISDGGETLDVALMLEIINKRIEYLYDREHTIGHAFFTCLKDDPTIDRLASIFEKSVIPLLQEYFYEDYGKIQLVLGDNGKTGDNKQFQFIRDEKISITDVFAANPEVDIPENKYFIQEEAFRKIESYKLIGKGL